MPSLDGYSLNEKIDKLHLEVKEDIVRLREEFTELYKKEAKPKASKKEKASAEKA